MVEPLYVRSGKWGAWHLVERVDRAAGSNSPIAYWPACGRRKPIRGETTYAPGRKCKRCLEVARYALDIVTKQISYREEA